MKAAPSDTLKGMACMVAGILLLATADAFTKWLIVDFHAGEIIFYRGFFAFLPLIPLIIRNGGWSSLRLQQPRGVWWRSELPATPSSVRTTVVWPLWSRRWAARRTYAISPIHVCSASTRATRSTAAM